MVLAMISMALEEEKERERERGDRCYADARPGDVNGEGTERKSFGGD